MQKKKNSKGRDSFWKRLTKKQLRLLRGGGSGDSSSDSSSGSSTGASVPPPLPPRGSGAGGGR